MSLNDCLENLTIPDIFLFKVLSRKRHNARKCMNDVIFFHKCVMFPGIIALTFVS